MFSSSHINFKILFLLIYLLSIAYIHFRGHVRFKILRQLTDHSSLLAPINALMYLSSSVPNTPYLKLDRLPELNILRDHWESIRDEALFLYKEGYLSASEKHDDIGFNSFFRRGWKRFYLQWYQASIPSAEKLCPKTMALIKTIPCMNAAMFALLPKNSFLFEHRDPYAGSLRYHLGLITPNTSECYISVDGQSYFWQDGQDVLFDETYIHHAKNTTPYDRIILFCDIQRPLNNPIAKGLNRVFSNTIMKASASKNLPHEPVGLINKAFKYLYQLRLIGKRLKEYNRSFYYCTKYTLYITLLGLFFIL